MGDLTRLRRLSCLAVLQVASASGPALATPALTLVTEYYPVAGTSLDEVRQQLEAHRARGSEGALGKASLSANLVWRFEPQPHRSGSCVTAHVTVKMSILMTVPRLDGDAPPDLRQHFADYVAALKIHEEGHITIYRRSMDAVEALLLEFPPNRCGELKAQADSAVRAKLESYKAEHVRYDADTRHGESQGAVFR